MGSKSQIVQHKQRHKPPEFDFSIEERVGLVARLIYEMVDEELQKQEAKL